MKKSFKKIGIFILDLMMVLSSLVIPNVIGYSLSGEYMSASASIIVAISIAFIMWVLIATLFIKMKRGWRYTLGIMLQIYIANGLYVLVGQFNFDTLIFSLMVLILSLAALTTGWKDVKNWSYQF